MVVNRNIRREQKARMVNAIGGVLSIGLIGFVMSYLANHGYPEETWPLAALAAAPIVFLTDALARHLKGEPPIWRKR